MEQAAPWESKDVLLGIAAYPAGTDGKEFLRAN